MFSGRLTISLAHVMNGFRKGSRRSDPDWRDYGDKGIPLLHHRQQLGNNRLSTTNLLFGQT